MSALTTEPTTVSTTDRTRLTVDDGDTPAVGNASLTSPVTDPTDPTDAVDPTGAVDPTEPTGAVDPTTEADPDPFGDWEVYPDRDSDNTGDSDGDWGDDWGAELPAAQINADLAEDDDEDAEVADLADLADSGGFLGDDRGMSTIEYALGCVAAAALGALLYPVVTSDSVESALTGIFERALETK